MKNKIKTLLFIIICLIINIDITNAATIGEGNYIISSALNKNKNIDVAGAHTDNGTNIHLWENNGNNAQKWQVKLLDNGYYSFSSLLDNNKCLSIKDTNYNKGTNIILTDCNESELQQFEIKDLNNGYFSIISKNNNLYLDISGANTNNGTNIALWENNGNNAQKWYFFEIIENKKNIYNGTYIIKSLIDNNKNIDVAGANTNNGTNIHLWENNENNAQKWYIEYQNNGYYILRSKLNTNKCLEIRNNNYTIHSNIQLSDCTKKDNQLFLINKNNNNYNIISKINHLYLNIFNGNTINGTNIELFYKTTTNSNTFILENAYPPKKSIGEGTYIISSALNKSKNIDVSGANTNNGTNINLWENNGNNAQKWIVKHLDNGYYTFNSLLDNNKCLSVKNDTFGKGTNIELNDCNESDLQQFEIKKVNSEYFSIIAKHNDVYLDVSGANTNNGTNIALWENNGNNAQKWYFYELVENKISIDDGIYIINTAADNTKNIDVSGANTTNGTNIQLWENNGNDAQKWIIEYQNNGYYIFKSKLNTKKCLEVKNNIYELHSNIQLSNCTKKDNQLFIIKDLGNNKYNFITKINHLYINLYNHQTNNKTNIELFYNEDTEYQQFELTTIQKTSLNNGTYIINSELDTNKNIDVTGAKSFNNTNINLWENNGNNAQIWFIKKQNNGYYTIRSGLNSTLFLSYENEENNANVKLSETPTEWKLEYYKNNKYYIITKNNNLYLNVENNKIKNGTNINILNSNNTNGQIFKFIDTDIDRNGNTISNSYYTIETKLKENQLIDAKAAAKTNGTNIYLWENNNNNAQIWYIKYLNNGYYKITSSMNPNVSMDISNENNVQLWKENNTDNQLWKLIDDENGNILIKSKSKNNCLTVDNSNYNNGSNVKVTTCNNDNNQKFILKRHINTKKYTGIDISQYQGNIDWQKVANTKLGFVIIRLGYGDNWTSQDDKKFVTNVENCERYNIPYGVYLYSYAKNVNGESGLNQDSESAASEAAHAIRLLNSVTYKPNLKTSVYIDMEEDSYDYLGKQTLTNIANYFCKEIEKNGYKCSTYANNHWLNDNLDTQNLNNKNNLWIAEWKKYNTHNVALNNNPSYNQTNYKLWQFTSVGQIDGIIGNVDLDIGYDIFD